MVLLLIITTVIVIMAEQEASDTTKQRCALSNLHVLRENPHFFFHFLRCPVGSWNYLLDAPNLCFVGNLVNEAFIQCAECV